MGDDTPMPVLSKKVRSLYDYFRQQFAQVTNPPIDSLRESIVMSLQTQIGPECNIFVPAPAACRTDRAEFARFCRSANCARSWRWPDSGVPNEFIDLQYDEALDLKTAILARMRSGRSGGARRQAGAAAVRSVPRARARCPIHALLATGAVHHRLVRTGLRCKCNILVETGTARDAHHFACLIGYGATAVYPYLAYQTLFDLMRKGALKMDADTRRELGRSYRRGIRKGLFKIMSKMGISTDRELPQRAAVRDRGAGRRGGVAVLRGLGEPHPGRGFRRPEARSAVPGAARVGPGRDRRTGRLAQVHARRRVPHVQPGRDRRRCKRR